MTSTIYKACFQVKENIHTENVILGCKVIIISAGI